ncbi:unnamed protein product [Didymodactylos carnosus]|uniref:Hermes trasposase DNA-binding domain-containing protein n=1 Tax=Didymodactylos carnosus TaxID=1234261 RepID=A0A814Z9Q5_9BILA|nr:unnamed protein product [Didymodactylos carnosus]CAF4002159.1 unnamed protein product [Didymodactylos carnosus]
MSLVNAKSNNNLTTKLPALVTAKDPTISFIKPAVSRSDCWTSFSQIKLSKVSQDYVVCLSCRTVLKWISGNGRQRTISSYCEAQPNDYATIKHQRTEACVEYCAVDSRSFESVSGDGFISLVKQLMNAGAIVGTAVPVKELLPHSSTVCRLRGKFIYSTDNQSIEEIPDTYNEKSSRPCINTDKCVAQTKLYDYLIEGNFMIVPNFYFGCAILEALLQST